MRIDNEKQINDIRIITTTGGTYLYYSTEWDYIQYDSGFIYIKFVETHSKDCMIYNKDHIISIEIG